MKKGSGLESLISIDMRKQHCLADLFGKCEGENAFDKCMQNTNGRTESTFVFLIKLWCTGMFCFLCDICCKTLKSVMLLHAAWFTQLRRSN